MQNVAMLTLAAPQNSWETARPQSHLSTGSGSRLESSTVLRSSQAGNETFGSQQIFSHTTFAAQPLQESMDRLVPSFSGRSSRVDPQHREESSGFPAEHVSRFHGGSVAGENSQLAFDTNGTQTTQLAEDEGLDAGAGSQIVGCAVVSILAPEALLPPPFPSAAPLRCCISNLATSAAHRKKGIATMLVKRCECVGRPLCLPPSLLPLLRQDGDPPPPPTYKTRSDLPYTVLLTWNLEFTLAVFQHLSCIAVVAAKKRESLSRTHNIFHPG